MTTPFYKKRPQCWIQLLNIFGISDKEYWQLILLPATTCFVVFFFFHLNILSQDNIVSQTIKYYFLICFPFTPFTRHLEIKIINLDPTVFGGGSGAFTFSILIAPFYFTYKLIKHYFSK